MRRQLTSSLSLSVALLGGISGCTDGTGPATETSSVADPRVAIFDAMAKSESASGRAECYLRVSGKNTDELQRLHELLLSRNLQVARSLRENRELSQEELARLEKLRSDILIGNEEIERQVSLTAASMSATQLQQARAVCQTKG